MCSRRRRSGSARRARCAGPDRRPSPARSPALRHGPKLGSASSAAWSGLSGGGSVPEGRWRRPVRGSRWARACSSAAAGCPGGTACRRWWRADADVEVGVVADLRRQVHRALRRRQQVGLDLAAQGAAFANSSQRRARSADAGRRPVRRARSAGRREAASTAAPLRRRTTWRRGRRQGRAPCPRSPRRPAAPRRPGQKTPSGRFWIGKSGWPLAVATQLRELRVVRPVGLRHVRGHHSRRVGSKCLR